MTYLTASKDTLAKTIWEASRADEGTISYLGANVVADALIASGAVIDASTLADDEALVETLCHARGYDQYDGDLWREQLAFVKQNLDDLTAALTERSQS